VLVVPLKGDEGAEGVTGMVPDDEHRVTPPCHLLGRYWNWIVDDRAKEDCGIGAVTPSERTC
jgi:hypothetical protein